jgi:hypothetical protein
MHRWLWNNKIKTFKAVGTSVTEVCVASELSWRGAEELTGVWLIQGHHEQPVDVAGWTGVPVERADAVRAL